MRYVLLSVIVAMTLAGLGQPAAAQTPQMPQTPGVAAGGDAAAEQQDPATRVRDLLRSAETVQVAALRCVSQDASEAARPGQGAGPCPLTSALNTTLGGVFYEPFTDGAGRDTALSTSLKMVLNGRVVEQTSAGPVETPVWPADTKVAVLHLVRYQADPQPLSERWVMATRGTRGITLTNAKRILGHKRLAVIFIHLDATVARGQRAEVRYGMLRYYVHVEEKLAVNVANFLAIFRLPGLSSSQTTDVAPPAPVGLLGFGTIDRVHVPSDVTVFGMDMQANPRAIGQPATYDNEGKAVWDVSVGVPANKLSLLEYSDSDGTFRPKQINKQSVYGLLNIYLKPVDLKAGKARWVVPRASVGIGIMGRPGESLFAGLSWGLPQFQFFAGTAFASTRQLKEGGDPADGTAYTLKYASRFTYGLNVPVSWAVKKLTAKSQSSASTQQ